MTKNTLIASECEDIVFEQEMINKEYIKAWPAKDAH